MITLEDTEDNFHKDGWKAIVENFEVTQLKAEIEIDKFSLSGGLPEIDIKRSLVDKLASGIIQRDLMTFSATDSSMTHMRLFRGSIGITDPLRHYVYRVNDAFVVEKNTFSEKELIEAVKYAFPERFI